ncbi:Ferritin L subunit [Intoshia linei]|uniref:Ferritin n=1 Tax=Intoshia linei TaxID=1819745 RepID=A0A177AX61_9BILA|nr:Ferritin L subunit [Intoshia linei]
MLNIDGLKSASEFFQKSLDLERKVNDSLLNLHKIASENNDPQCCDFLETEFLDEQIKSINQIGHYLTKLELVGDKLGLYVFDKEEFETKD